MDTLEQVRARFQADRFATENGMVIDSCADGCAVCSMELSERHRNAAGRVMGGAMFTLADFAAAVAENWNRPLCVTRSSHITFLGAPKGNRLTAEAKIVKSGRRACCCLTEVRDGLGNLAALVTSDGFLADETPQVSGTAPRR